MHKLVDIQKLRAFAILMVLFGHMPIALPGVLLHGYTGVTLFFVISGYVVTLSFVGREPASDTPFGRRSLSYLRDFYVRRVFRILPVMVFWVLTSITIVELITRAGGTLPWSVPGGWRTEVLWLLSGVYNYRFAAQGSPAIFGHFWSLAVEMHFYVVLPILLLLFRRREARLAVCVVAATLVATIMRALTPSSVAGFLTHTQADALFMGVLLCLLFAQKDRPWRPEFARDFAIPQVAKNLIVVTLALALFVSPYALDGRVDALFKYPLYTVLATALVFLAQRNTGWILGEVPVSDRLLTFLGDRSYSYYLCHPILWFGLYSFAITTYGSTLPPALLTSGPGIVVQACILFLLALVAADLSFRFIEQPFIRLGKAVVRSFNGQPLRDALVQSWKQPAPTSLRVGEPAIEAVASEADGGKRSNRKKR